MKCTVSRRKWQAIYRLLDRVSPVPYDCGSLCGARCCTYEQQEDEEDMGIYLYPGEQLVHRRPSNPEEDWLDWTVENSEDYDFPDSWVGPVYFVKCKTPPECPRKLRPLQCRTFPLKPYLTEDGELELVSYYDELPYSCPLIANEMGIDERFYRATYTVWSHLIRDPLIRDLVELDSEYYDEVNSEMETDGSI